MDKIQLITIAISTVFGMVLKSIISWIVSIIKTTETVKAITAKLKIVFSKTNRAIMFKVLILLFYVGVLVNFSISESTPTRFEILLIIGAAFTIIFVALFLIWDISVAVNERKNKP